MLASPICAGKPSCFKFACFCEWCVEIWLFSYFTGAVMYCVPQGWKSTKLNVTDHALLKERSLTLKRKALSMFDSPTPSHTGINVVPVAETASVLLQLREFGSRLWTQSLNMCVPKHPSPSTLSFRSTPAVGIKGNWKHKEFTGTHLYLPHGTVGSALLLTARATLWQIHLAFLWKPFLVLRNSNPKG